MEMSLEAYDEALSGYVVRSGELDHFVPARLLRTVAHVQPKEAIRKAVYEYRAGSDNPRTIGRAFRVYPAMHVSGVYKVEQDPILEMSVDEWVQWEGQYGPAAWGHAFCMFVLVDDRGIERELAEAKRKWRELGEAADAELKRLRAENARLRMPWWRRLVARFADVRQDLAAAE